MKNLSLYKKISLYFTYIKLIRGIENDLKRQFNTRVDRVGRLYTVLNIPPSLIEEPYNLRKSDLDTIAQTYVKEFSNELSKFLNSRGLVELYDFYDIEKVDKYSYLIIYGYSLFNTQKAAKSIMFRWIPTIATLSLFYLIYLKLK